MGELFYIKMVSKTIATLCALTGLLTGAATWGYEINSIRMQNKIHTEQVRLDERAKMLTDFQEGLALEGNHRFQGSYGSVIIKGDSVVLFPTGYTPEQLRLYGMTREEAQKYLDTQKQRLGAQKSQLNDLETSI